MEIQMLPKINTGITASKSGIYGGFGAYQGIDLYIKEDGEFTLFWYAPDGRYYIAHCMAGMDDFVISTTSGGTFENPASRIETPIGTGTLDMDEGVFYYITDEHGRGSIGFTEKYPSEQGGVYFQPDQIGSGFSIKRFGRYTSCYWYTYNKGSQQWFLCSGVPDALVVYHFADCRINYPGGVAVECGTASLAGDIFTYDINALGIVDSGTRILTRAF
jgi:hypothetical protein